MTVSRSLLSFSFLCHLRQWHASDVETRRMIFHANRWTIYHFFIIVWNAQGDMGLDNHQGKKKKNCFGHLSYNVPPIWKCFGFSVFLLGVYPPSTPWGINHPYGSSQPQTVKTAWARLGFWQGCFIRRGKGFKRNRWCLGGKGGLGGRLQRGGTGSRSIQVSGFQKACPFSAERQWRDLPGSKRALQQTFQQSFGVCWDNRMLH